MKLFYCICAISQITSTNPSDDDLIVALSGMALDQRPATIGSSLSSFSTKRRADQSNSRVVVGRVSESVHAQSTRESELTESAPTNTLGGGPSVPRRRLVAARTFAGSLTNHLLQQIWIRSHSVPFEEVLADFVANPPMSWTDLPKLHAIIHRIQTETTVASSFHDVLLANRDMPALELAEKHFSDSTVVNIEVWRHCCIEPLMKGFTKACHRVGEHTWTLGKIAFLDYIAEVDYSIYSSLRSNVVPISLSESKNILLDIITAQGKVTNPQSCLNIARNRMPGLSLTLTTASGVFMSVFRPVVAHTWFHEALVAHPDVPREDMIPIILAKGSKFYADPVLIDTSIDVWEKYAIPSSSFDSDRVLINGEPALTLNSIGIHQYLSDYRQQIISPP